jgi:ferritin-like metal-binding protein YciE
VQIETMEDLLEDQLREIYGAERQFAAELPKLIWQSSSLSLRLALSDQFQETERQVDRLGEVFTALGKPPRGAYCPGIQSFLDEADRAARRGGRGVFLDAATVASAQRVARYAVATYSRAIAYAKLLDQRTVAELLADSLAEERTVIETLGSLSEDSTDEIQFESHEVQRHPILRQA